MRDPGLEFSHDEVASVTVGYCPPSATTAAGQSASAAGQPLPSSHSFIGEDRSFCGAALFIDLVPKTCYMTNARSAVSKKDWDRIRTQVYARAGNRCECCGVLGSMEAHERWQFIEKPVRTQKLVRLVALCHACHEATHMGLARIKGRGKQAMKHLSQVTGLRGSVLEAHVDEAWALWTDRSEHNWELDVSMLALNGFKIVHHATPETRAKISAHAGTSTPKQAKDEVVGEAAVFSAPAESTGAPARHSVDKFRQKFIDLFGLGEPINGAIVGQRIPRSTWPEGHHNLRSLAAAAGMTIHGRQYGPVMVSIDA